MRIRLLIIRFLGIVPILTFSQGVNYFSMAYSICEEINQEQIRDTPTEEIQAKLIWLGYNVNEKYKTDVDELVNKLKSEHQDWSDNDCLKEYLKRFVHYSIDSCPVYFELMLIPLGDSPSDNKALQLLKKKVEKCILENSDKPYVELNNKIKWIMLDFLFDNKELIERNYKGEHASSQFFKDMNSYLSHRSREYLKISLSVEIDKMFNN